MYLHVLHMLLSIYIYLSLTLTLSRSLSFLEEVVSSMTYAGTANA